MPEENLHWLQDTGDFFLFLFLFFLSVENICLFETGSHGSPGCPRTHSSLASNSTKILSTRIKGMPFQFLLRVCRLLLSGHPGCRAGFLPAEFSPFVFPSTLSSSRMLVVLHRLSLSCQQFLGLHLITLGYRAGGSQCLLHPGGSGDLGQARVSGGDRQALYLSDLDTGPKDVCDAG